MVFSAVDNAQRIGNNQVSFKKLSFKKHCTRALFCLPTQFQEDIVANKLQLSDEDRRLVRIMRDDVGVLVKIDERRTRQKDGIVLVPCGDGDQMPDIFGLHLRLCRAHMEKPRIHTVSLNGGPLVIPDASPLSWGLPDSEVMLRHILMGCRRKGIGVIALVGHAPCVAASDYKLNASQVVRLVAEAKYRIKNQLMFAKGLGDVKVDCFFQVDWAHKQSSYFIDEEKLKAARLR